MGGARDRGTVGTGHARVDPRRVARFRRELLAWYRRARRDLPWRRDKDAYRVWISEAMLQQTRVETVIPYHERFLARFPTVAALARASEEDVLAAWSGLGYYRRARALRAAARAIVERHGGRFPERREEALALPGIGPYTAGAVLSIAYSRPEPLVDGNVARVFARLFALEPPLGSAALARALDALARALVPPAPGTPGADDPGDWNQALMELGATVCTPRDPGCLACPLRGECAARRQGREGELPRAAPAVAPLAVELEILFVRRRRAGADEALVVRRPATGRMAGLWEPPTRELGTADGGPGLLWPARFPGAEHGLVLRTGAELASVAHSITRHRIRARVRAGRSERGAAPDAPVRWVPLAELDGVALTGLASKALRKAIGAVAGGARAR